MKIKKAYFLIVFLVLLSSCNPTQQIISTEEIIQPTDVVTTATATPFIPEEVEIVDQSINLWIPEYFQDVNLEWIDSSLIDLTQAEQSSDCKIKVDVNSVSIGNFVYALIEPFDTLKDSITSQELLSLLTENFEGEEGNQKILLSEKTMLQFQELFGNLSNQVQITSENEILQMVSSEASSLGIIRFENLEPDVKVLKVDGISPFDKVFQPDEYKLTIPINLECTTENQTNLVYGNIANEITNRDPSKLTSVLITGTTALTRATANRMDLYGMTYPGEKVKDWFEGSDIRHVSSETPFFEECGPGDPYLHALSFCSLPIYTELFFDLNIDAIELTGNHLLDKGYDYFETTLSLFDQLGLKYYAGGYTLEQAQQALLFEHNGNKFAFLGCNTAGPPNVWATSTRGGVYQCDFEAMTDQIKGLVTDGYLPIVTFQYYESRAMNPSNQQIREFRSMVQAGAVIVSGSQSHNPMSMEFYNGSFIHYGLGNLFFDQMSDINNRREFLDRHIFYDGKYVGVEILTAMLEDYAQPRPMTEDERSVLLSDSFRYFLNVTEREN